jgi:riboflavin kinase/FMN adenylyltransferase
LRESPLEYFRELDEYRNAEPSVVTLGKFDGVHLGHRLLLEKVREISAEENLVSIAVTFDAPPSAKIHHTKGLMLMTNRERRDLLEEEGMDFLVECVFNEQFRSLSPAEFVRNILMDRFHVSALVVGDDFRFGKDRAGDAAFLKKTGMESGFSVYVVGKKKDPESGQEISSSWIRSELREGHMETVTRLLGRPYFISGKIVHGKQIGHRMGIPTINQIPEDRKMLPPNGVYFSFAEIGGQKYHGVTNIGIRPTVSGEGLSVETHLLDCSGDFYEDEARISLLHFLRAERKFDSVEVLRDQIRKDVRAADEYFQALQALFESPVSLS